MLGAHRDIGKFVKHVRTSSQTMRPFKERIGQRNEILGYYTNSMDPEDNLVSICEILNCIENMIKVG